MNPILDMLMSSGGGEAVQTMARQFGLSQDQTSSALGQIVPALMAGLQQNASQPGGLEGLLGALNTGSHSRYLDDPGLLVDDATRQDGNSILGHILGSKDVSREVAGRTAEQTGIGTDIIKKMLPIVATMVMGSLSRQNAAASAQGLNAGDMIGSLLGQKGGGSMASGVAGLLGRLFGGR
jgi:hypothetical protein